MKKESSETTKNSLFDFILLIVSAAVMIVGIHQTYVNGFGSAYWIFMISIAVFLYYQIRKLKKKQEANQPKLNRRAKRYMSKNG